MRLAVVRRPGRGVRRCGNRRTEQGSGLVEVIWLSLVLLIPLVYLLLTVVAVQRSAYGVTEAARSAGRAYVLAPNPAAGRQRAYAAALVAMRDQSLGLPSRDLVVVCHPTPTSCLRPGSSVEIRIRYDARLPLLPTFLGHNPASIAVTAKHVEPYGSYRETRP